MFRGNTIGKISIFLFNKTQFLSLIYKILNLLFMRSLYNVENIFFYVLYLLAIVSEAKRAVLFILV